jgi:hypothetical protein
MFTPDKNSRHPLLVVCFLCSEQLQPKF